MKKRKQCEHENNEQVGREHITGEGRKEMAAIRQYRATPPSPFFISQIHRSMKETYTAHEIHTIQYASTHIMYMYM